MTLDKINIRILCDALVETVCESLNTEKINFWGNVYMNNINVDVVEFVNVFWAFYCPKTISREYIDCVCDLREKKSIVYYFANKSVLFGRYTLLTDKLRQVMFYSSVENFRELLSGVTTSKEAELVCYMTDRFQYWKLFDYCCQMFSNLECIITMNFIEIIPPKTQYTRLLVYQKKLYSQLREILQVFFVSDLVSVMLTLV